MNLNLTNSPFHSPTANFYKGKFRHMPYPTTYVVLGTNRNKEKNEYVEGTFNYDLILTIFP